MTPRDGIRCVAAVVHNGKRCRNLITFGVRLCRLHLWRARAALPDWDGTAPHAFTQLYKAVGAKDQWL